MKTYDDLWGPIQSHLPAARVDPKSQAILDHLQPKRRQETAAWLTELFKDSPETDRAHQDSWLPQRDALIEASAKRWVDALFKDFATFTRQFSQSTFSDKTQVVITPPKPTFRVADRRDPSPDPYKFTCYQGHLSTHSWTLLARAFYDTVQIFIVPHNLLFGLILNSLTTNEVNPFVELRPAVDKDDVTWALSGRLVTMEMIPAMARELFGDLIRVSSGVMHESELFQHPERPLLFGETIAVSGDDQEQPPALSPTNKNNESPELGPPSRFNAELADLLRDLQIWQAHELIARVVKYDIKKLDQYLLQHQAHDAYTEQIETLKHEYESFQLLCRAFFESLDKRLQSTTVACGSGATSLTHACEGSDMPN